MDISESEIFLENILVKISDRSGYDGEDNLCVFLFCSIAIFLIQREEYKTYTSSLPFQIPGGSNPNQ